MNKLIVALTLGAATLALSGQALASGNAANGAELAKKYNCASCHGADFKTPIDPTYPKLAGQHADYLVHALTSYQRGNKGIQGVRTLVHQSLQEKREVDGGIATREYRLLA